MFLLVCEAEVGELFQAGGMWRLLWGLLCGTSGRMDLCIVPCHSCHIYGIWTSRSKKVWEMLKSYQLGVVMQVTKVGLFCFTFVLRVWGWQSQKCNSNCLNDINVEYSRKVFKFFYFTPENSISLTLPPSVPLCLFFPLWCLHCNFWQQPSFWYKQLYPYSLTRIHYCNWKCISRVILI